MANIRGPPEPEEVLRRIASGENCHIIYDLGKCIQACAKRNDEDGFCSVVDLYVEAMVPLNSDLPPEHARMEILCVLEGLAMCLDDGKIRIPLMALPDPRPTHDMFIRLYDDKLAQNNGYKPRLGLTYPR